MKKYIYVICMLAVQFIFAQNDALFQQATDLYNKGNYQKALNNYAKIEASGQVSAALFYNMGNVHYKLSNVAESIYYYEKALTLAPQDTDIKNNLKFAQNMTVDAITPLPKTSIQRFFNNTIGSYNYEGWGVISLVLMGVLIISFLVYMLTDASAAKRISFIVGCVMILTVITSWSFAFTQLNTSKNTVYAIVFAEEVAVKNEPNQIGEDAFILHKGTKLQVLETLNTWQKVKLADGKTGWLQKQAVKAI